MEERFRNHYFVLLRIALLLVLEVYIILSQSILTGASVKVLLLLALFIGVVAGKELVEQRYQIILLVIAGIIWFIMLFSLGKSFILLGVYLCYEALTHFKPSMPWYILPVGIAFIPSDIGASAQFVIAALVGFIYFQHDFVVEPYHKQTKEDTITEQRLKHDINRTELKMQEEVRKSLLMAENQMLEERAELSQTLHDKLGHNINGSVYQLEAVKLLMEKEPETSKKMIQAVIDQLRSGMDEIRLILRKKRPEKYKLAILQLEKLCEECRVKGVETELITEGELKDIPEKHLEVILDNAYEAVSNSMKYSKCSKIKISIRVLNKMIRCSISDNGIGCNEIIDGMGISGMRKRIREINGILDFETEAGFTINMLLPI
ncbi:MAG: histidine kinase [Acutalibacteraceae bacterium]|nr:histidine kinase [Acutalibacteraceae bacterium]